MRVAAILAALVLLASCTASIDGTPGATLPSGSSSSGSSSSGSSSSGSSSSGPPPVVDGFPTGGAALTALLHKGAQAVHSSHFVQRVDIGGITVTGPGDQVYHSSALVGFRQVAIYPGGQRLVFLVIGTQAWARIPSTILDTPKPWTLLRTDSTNRVIRLFAAAMPSSTDPPAPTTAMTLAAASDTVTFAGVTTLGVARSSI